MPSPISQFGYTVNELEVQFISLSLNTVDESTFQWDFGDTNVSSEESPEHTYSEPGFYNVTLTVTNPDNTTGTSVTLINVSMPFGNIAIFQNIEKLVDLYTPTQIIGTVTNHKQKEFLIAKWQAYLQPLMVEPEIIYPNTYNQSAWPPLANSLIAKLVVIDIIQMEATKFLLTAASEGAGSSTIIETGSGTGTGNGGIKSIETGPTKVERYENKDSSSNSEKVSNLAKAYQNLITQGGLLDELQRSACDESKRLSVYLPQCGPLPSPNKGFSVTKNKKGGYNANPFGITKRMI